jgi:hypothetical protein
MNRPAPISVFSDQRRTKSTIWSRVSCGTQTPVTWRAKASSPVTGRSLDCGHFLQEEHPEETFEELDHFFSTV